MFEITIPEEHITDVLIKWSCNEPIYPMSITGSISHQDHPSFAKVRDILDEYGFIKAWRGVWNGDRVLKEFKFNGKHFKKGEKFPCASAQRCKRDYEKKKDII